LTACFQVLLKVYALQSWDPAECGPAGSHNRPRAGARLADLGGQVLIETGTRYGLGRAVPPFGLRPSPCASPRPSRRLEPRPEGRRYKSAFQNLGHPLLDFLNVRAVALEESAAAPSRFELVRNGSPLRLYRNPSALPRFFLPIAVDVRDRASALEGLHEMRDARRVVLTREDAGSWRALERPWDPAAVRILHSRAGRVSLLLPAIGQKLLATSLPFPDGWTATAEGRTLRSVVVNTAYFGAVVPPGVARVDLIFTPPGLHFGAALSALGIAALGLLLTISRAGREAPGSSRRTESGEVNRFRPKVWRKGLRYLFTAR
jgi:hypothetical protein